jgi:predicted metal-dependent peptidase
MAVAIDQSGSMTDELISRLMIEIEELGKYIDFDVLPFDDVVDEANIQRVKKGQHYKFVRTRFGGTNFSAVQKWVDQQGKYNFLIFLTDLGDMIPYHGKTQRMWIAKADDTMAKFFRDNGEKVVLL